MLNFFDAVASVAALVWALAVGACIFLAIDWDGLFEAKYIKVFLVVAIIAQATLFIIKKIGAVLYCGMFASLTISVLGMIVRIFGDYGCSYVWHDKALSQIMRFDVHKPVNHQ